MLCRHGRPVRSAKKQHASEERNAQPFTLTSSPRALRAVPVDNADKQRACAEFSTATPNVACCASMEDLKSSRTHAKADLRMVRHMPLDTFHTPFAHAHKKDFPFTNCSYFCNFALSIHARSHAIIAHAHNPDHSSPQHIPNTHHMRTHSYTGTHARTSQTFARVSVCNH